MELRAKRGTIVVPSGYSRGVDSTLLNSYRASNHSKIVESFLQVAVAASSFAGESAQASAWRFMSMSRVAYLLVVFTLACPNH